MDLTTMVGLLFGTGFLGQVVKRSQMSRSKRAQRLEAREVENNKTLRESYAEYIAGIDECARIEDGLIAIGGETLELEAYVATQRQTLADLDSAEQDLRQNMLALERATEAIATKGPSLRSVRAQERRLDEARRKLDSIGTRLTDARRDSDASIMVTERLVVSVYKFLERGAVVTKITRGYEIDLQLRDGNADRRAALKALTEAPEPDRERCTTLDETVAEVKRCQLERINRRNTLLGLLGGLDAPGAALATKPPVRRMSRRRRELGPGG